MYLYMTFVIRFIGMSNFITLIVLYIQSSLITIIENNRYVQLSILSRESDGLTVILWRLLKFLLGGSSHRIINIQLLSFHVSSDFKLMRCLLKI